MGARLKHFHSRWEESFPDNPWILNVVTEGVRLTFNSRPSLTTSPVWISPPSNPEKAAALRAEVQALRQKQAIDIVDDPGSPGFYSHLFVVPKPDGSWRPIIDLSALNLHITTPSFRMETVRSLRASVKPDEWAVSIDLRDAYLHVPMHPSTQRFLRFAIDDEVFFFRALPFGLSLSPWIFTRLIDAVVELSRQKMASEISNYLDDFLLKNACPNLLVKDRDSFMLQLRSLGWMINDTKSDLTPSQEFVHLGMCFRTQINLVCLPQKRLDKLLSAVHEICSRRVASARQLHSVLGLCSAAADLVPLGRLHLRPIQWALTQLWSQRYNDWDIVIDLSPSLLDAFRVWTNTEWLLRGVPLLLPTTTVTLCTDASTVGWGAHLLPSFETVAGLWSTEETLSHINVLEMKAVLLAIQHWTNTLRHQAVLLMSDNSTVVAYIRNQGGTHSRELCLLTCELLQLCSALQIHLRVSHIPGRLNVMADSLSRNQSIPTTEWSLHREIFQRILILFPTMEIDLFATRLNNQLPKFVSPFPDPVAFATDGLQFPLDGKDLYCFPPTVLVPRLLQRLSQSQCLLTLVAPLRWKRSWISTVIQRLAAPPRRLPCLPNLLCQPSGILHPTPELLNLHIFRLYGGPLKARDSLMEQWHESLRTGAPLL